MALARTHLVRILSDIVGAHAFAADALPWEGNPPSTSSSSSSKISPKDVWVFDDDASWIDEHPNGRRAVCVCAYVAAAEYLCVVGVAGR
jgi:hypothetical protein